MNNWQTAPGPTPACAGTWLMTHEMFVTCRNLSSCILTWGLFFYLSPWASSRSVRCPHRLPFLPQKIYTNHGLRQMDFSLTMKRVFSPSAPFHYTSHFFEKHCPLKVCCRYQSSLQMSCAYWVVSYVISGVYSMLAVRTPFLKMPSMTMSPYMKFLACNVYFIPNT